MPARKRRNTARAVFASEDGFIVEDVQNGWHLQAWIGFSHGIPWITELRIRSANGNDLEAAHGGKDPSEHYRHDAKRPVPAGGVTTEVLRKNLHLTPLYDAISADENRSFVLAAHGVDSDTDLAGLAGLVRPGRRGRDNLFYAEWAQRYLVKCATSRKIYPDLAEEHHYDARTIRAFVDQARKRGLLAGTSKGRAGGWLTPKAKKLLEQPKGEGE